MPLVREATAEDLPAIRETREAAIRAAGPAAYDADQVDAWVAADDSSPARAVGDPDARVVVAEAGDRVVGVAALGPADAEVTGCFVHPDHARRGVGSALMARLESTARERGRDRLELSASKNAVPFYQRLGYEVASEAARCADERDSVESSGCSGPGGTADVRCVRMTRDL